MKSLLVTLVAFLLILLVSIFIHGDVDVFGWNGFDRFFIVLLAIAAGVYHWLTESFC